jgi:hypothetical protein
MSEKLASRSRSREIGDSTSLPAEFKRNPEFEVFWEVDDPENPESWPNWYKGFIVGSVSFTVTIVYILLNNIPEERPNNNELGFCILHHILQVSMESNMPLVSPLTWWFSWA